MLLVKNGMARNICLVPYTSYNKANSRLDFQLIGNQYSGYTVELFLQRNGNLSTQEISPTDF